MSKEEKIVCACKRCGYTWKPRNSQPKICPNCKSKYWSTEKLLLVCALCKYKWYMKQWQKPDRCPACKSWNWDNENLRELDRLTQEIGKYTKEGNWSSPAPFSLKVENNRKKVEVK